MTITAQQIDLYIVEAVEKLRDAGADQPIYVTIGCYQYYTTDDKKTITHKLHYGCSDNEIKLEGNDLHVLCDKALQMLAIRGDIAPPREYTAMLPPPEAPVVDYAEFDPVSSGNEDDIPF